MDFGSCGEIRVVVVYGVEGSKGVEVGCGG